MTVDFYAVVQAVDQLREPSGAGAGKNPTVAVLEQIAAALQVAITELFTVPPENEAPPAPLPSGRMRNRLP